MDNTPLNQTRPTETQPAVTEKSVGKTNRNQTDNNGTEVENLILTTIATNVSEVEKNTTQRPTEKPAVTVGITSENVTSLNSTQREAEATQESLNITSSGTENTTISSVTTSTFGAANISELLNMTDITNVTEITRTFTNITELANATGITSGNITDLLNTTESTFVNNATITNAEGNVTEAGRNHTIESSNFTTVAVANETSVEILTNTTFVSLLNTTESHNESEVIITPIVPISKNETEKANSTGFPLLNITEFVASVNDSPIINVNEEFGEVVRLQFDLAENLTSELPSFSTEKFEGSGEEGFTLPVSISTEVTTDRITPSKKTAIPTPSTFVPHTDSSKSLTIDEFEDRRLRDEGFLLDEARGRRNVFGSTNVPQMQAVRDVNHRDELQLDVNQEMFVLEPDDADQFLGETKLNSN